MENTDTIQITISGKIGNVPVSPDNYDIRQAKLVLGVIEDLLYPGKKGKHAPITYAISEGSIVNTFKTSVQAAMGLLAALSVVAQTDKLDTLDQPVANAIEALQKEARQNGLSYTIGAPASDEPLLTISSATDYMRHTEQWAEAEFYLYGQIYDAGGGGNNCNIHLRTKEYGKLVIAADQQFLRNIEHNILYRNYEIVAQGRQNIWTGEMDKTSLKIISMKGHNPKYDEERLNRLIAKATPAWVGITDPAVWVADLRGLSD